MKHRFFFLTLILMILLGGILQSVLPSKYEFRNEDTITRTDPVLASTIYLPLITRPDTFLQNCPIWTHHLPPDPHEVVLFRHRFTLDEQLGNPRFFIFADTRYEVWIDGSWIGRGPARFSRTRREYDVYQLDTLQPGAHLIAVLVQWAPNARRSESDTPFLMGHLQGMARESYRVITRTGPQWRALASDAWRRDAVQVHSSRLIGPTELVDLRELPHNWMQPAFSDEEWPSAVVKDFPGEAVYRPRSIPLLANVPFTPTVVDAGLLSPGYGIGELGAWLSTPYTLTFEAIDSTEFFVETLTTTKIVLPGLALLDGGELAWAKVGDYRPDVYIASAMIRPGTHTLSFADIPPQGLTFGVSTRNVQIDLPFQQGAHAGRRLLLAEPISQSDAVLVTSEEGLTVEFAKSPAYIVLDLGRTVHGRLTADVTGPAGTVVDIGWDERLTGAHRPLPYPGSLHPQWNQTDSWVLDGMSHSISTIDARAGRYILIAAWGDNPIKLEDIIIYEERYPVEQKGEFHSSNPLLDEIWQVGVDTLRPNMTDAYTDTPWRERGQWWGDAYVEDHINRVAFGDIKLLQRGLLFMAEAFAEGRPPAMAPNSDQTLLLDYGMLWVQSLHDYYQVTEDTQFLIQVYPVLCEFMTYLEIYENPSTGLLDVPFGEWWETALIDWHAGDSRYGQSTALNALYYATLVDAAHIAQATSNISDNLDWRQKAERVKLQVNSYLYLPAQHRYVASVTPEDVLPPSIHAQTWALACVLVPEAEVELVISSLLELPLNIQIYGMFWVLEALGNSNHIPEALDIIQTRYGGLLDLGATTWWEGFNANSRYDASLSHSWGGAPTWFLTTYVLGARQIGPDAWSVRPAFEGAKYASGSLPFQKGEIWVHWERSSCENSKLEIIAPAHTTGEIIIPFAGDMTVLTLNDQVIWQRGIPLVENVVGHTDGISVYLPGGEYTLHAHQDCHASLLPSAFDQATFWLQGQAYDH